MDIHVNRNGQGFGPYEANEAKSLYARGNIAATDLVWHDGMTEWQTARQLFGERPIPSVAPPIAPPHPVPPRQAPPVPGFEAPRSSYANQTAVPDMQLQSPPKLHWALVLLFGVLSFGIFIAVWAFVQSTWVRKINPQSNATNYLIGYVALAVVGAVMGEADSSATQGLGVLLQLASYVLFYCGYYSMRRSMIDYFNKVEPIGLQLSGVMLFFFSVLYLQHHMTRIAEWKKTGNITPQ
jgi:hypothetical protein